MEKREEMEETEGRKAMKGEKEKLKKEKGNTTTSAGRQDPPRFTCMSGDSSPEVLWRLLISRFSRFSRISRILNKFDLIDFLD